MKLVYLGNYLRIEISFFSSTNYWKE